MGTWDGMEELVAVANAGSFIGGARTLGVSAAHITRAIARLEVRVQNQLFIRTTRTIRLTATGQTLLDHCRRIVLERDEAFAMVGEGGEPQGDLRVTCSAALGERFLAPIIRRFCERHPKVSVVIELNNCLVDLVGEGFDLAVRTGTLADSRLIGTRIAYRTHYACAATDYLARRGIPSDVSELSQHECLAGTATAWHFKVGDQQHFHRPQGRWRCNSGTAVVDAALAGMGICQLPEFYVLPYIRSGQLQQILGKFQPDEEPIWAVYPQRRHLLPKISRLVEALRDELPAALEGARIGPLCA
ncbi:LysR family transcriptional regulator [Sphingobium boeckii]|uniref:DNA-binding transcriptional LysR family regulator n=1 Tax=Sphingobium boeckii TaxID=1082345 RepID=A0A7W9AIZ2_9SPHN|nr:LysR family transcriptional regulator [Sphingobium boeckii]MBB5686326.1 DNA-binding transcriptional LysR family regulator [Sphingobium boeckii]